MKQISTAAWALSQSSRIVRIVLFDMNTMTTKRRIHGSTVICVRNWSALVSCKMQGAGPVIVDIP